MDLKNTVLIDLSIGLWSGSKKLSVNDLLTNNANNVNGIELPPDNLASLGSKKLIDPETLKPFQAVKASARRVLDKYGTRFLSGWVADKKYSAEIDAELGRLKQDFALALSDFLVLYDSRLNEWLGKFPDWAEILDSGSLTEEKVKRSFIFSYTIYQLAEPDSGPEAVTVSEAGSLSGKLAALPDVVFDSVADMAGELLGAIGDDVAAGGSVKRRRIGALKKIRDRLNTLSFIHTEALGVLRLLDETVPIIEGFDKTGDIEDDERDLFIKLTTALTEPVVCRDIGRSYIPDFVSEGDSILEEEPESAPADSPEDIPGHGHTLF